MEGIKMENQLQATFPISDIQMPTTPTNLFDMSFENIIEFCYIRGARKKHKADDEDFGYEDLQMMPEILIAMDEIRLASRKSNQADFYCTMGTWGHSIIQHRYNLDYKAMAGARTTKWNEGKLNGLAGLVRDGQHLFEKIKGCRPRVSFYASVGTVLAPTSEYSKYFQTSKSDIIQVYLCEAIIRYEPLHENNKKFFKDTLEEFDQRVRDVQGKMAQI
jgi:hypothetical protein